MDAYFDELAKEKARSKVKASLRLVQPVPPVRRNTRKATAGTQHPETGDDPT